VAAADAQGCTVLRSSERVDGMESVNTKVGWVVDTCLDMESRLGSRFILGRHCRIESAA
jgi:hypothetical protein